MTRDIITNLEVIKQSVAWADKYEKDSFPREVFKNYRRKLRRIGEALSENCSAAAYGESQVGKSYLMSSLLSTPDAPFAIIKHVSLVLSSPSTTIMLKLTSAACFNAFLISLAGIIASVTI